VLRRRIVERLMDEGVSFVDPGNVYIDATVRIGRDSLIEPGVVITGNSILGEGCHIKAGCVIEDSRIADDVTIGPSAHLRPGNELAAGVKVGNFVELKNSKLGRGTKAAHLGYIGDADVGAHVNFSCGAIVVNYDGYKKSRTIIGDDAFIGCNVNLVSPVEIAPHAFVAAGSTITKNVPIDALAIARDRQRNIEGWVARKEGRSPARDEKETGAPAGSVASPDEDSKEAAKTGGRSRPRPSVRSTAKQGEGLREKPSKRAGKKQGKAASTKKRAKATSDKSGSNRKKARAK